MDEEMLKKSVFALLQTKVDELLEPGTTLREVTEEWERFLEKIEANQITKESRLIPISKGSIRIQTPMPLITRSFLLGTTTYELEMTVGIAEKLLVLGLP
jgi:hypothetical protein